MNKAYEFDKETAPKLAAIEKKFIDTQVEIMKYSNKLQDPIYKERDELLKSVDKFWTKALGNCGGIMIYIDDEDKPIFDHLAAIRVDRSQTDPREATVHFDFDANDYFSDSTLTRAFKVKDGAEPINGDFDFQENVESAKTIIHWKSDEKNQTKLRPTVLSEDGDMEPGSFFASFFEQEDATMAAAIGDALINDFYPRAIDYFTDEASMLDDFEGEDFDDEEDEDSEDDDREIDLEEEERRPKKKTKNA